MIDTQTACAHCNVVLKHRDYPGGARSDYWECSDGCGAMFLPANTDQCGRRLRDWFAGMALQGLLVKTENGAVASIVVDEAYRFADLMIHRRMPP